MTRTTLALSALSLFALTGCIDLDGDGNPDINVGAEICLGNHSKVGNTAGIEFDLCVAIGDSNMVGSPFLADGVHIEWVNAYAEQAYQDDNYAVTDFNVSCTVEDSEGDLVPATAHVYTDGAIVDIYIPDIPSHFEAECTGSVTLGYGASDVLFIDDNSKGETTHVEWEDETIDDVRERNGELQIDFD